MEPHGTHKRTRSMKITDDNIIQIFYCIWAVSYTHLDVYKRQEQEILRSQIMGTGSFGRNNRNITVYTMKLYNEAKYLEPTLPFQSFARHISKHLPMEVQITLMTREVSDINELEKILDVFQNIKDQEDSRRIQQLNMQNGGNYTPRGGPNGGTTQNGRERDRRYPVSYTHLLLLPYCIL